MTLSELLNETGDRSNFPYGGLGSTAFQVFGRDDRRPRFSRR